MIGRRAIVAFLEAALPKGLLLHLHAADHYLHGEPEIRLLPGLSDRARTSLDIGANIGTYTYFLRRVSRQVYAYEPNPELAARLRRLFPDVVVRHAAVSDRPGNISLRIPVEDGRVQHELASVAQSFADTDDVREFVVTSVRIDDEGLSDVGFIKIDVEQHELPVLRGALNTIRQNRPAILCEVTPLLYPRPVPEMFEFLTDLGYEGWFKFEGAYHPFRDFEPDVHANRLLRGTRFMSNNVVFLPEGMDSSFLPKP